MTSFINLQRRNLLKYAAIGIASALTYLKQGVLLLSYFNHKDRGYSMYYIVETDKSVIMEKCRPLESNTICRTVVYIAKRPIKVEWLDNILIF